LPIGSGGVGQILQYRANPHGVVPELGYPLYFFLILGIWKVLGAIAILVPRFPRLKEWAYAGIFFDLTGAAASCAAVGGYGAYAFHVIAPLIITGFTMASWALRPESRKIGVLLSLTHWQGGISTRASEPSLTGRERMMGRKYCTRKEIDTLQRRKETR
jgi:uncharacterized membrane protein YphA (DoxX/SURF4 family)